jgi:hypothetical protein
MFGSGAQAEKDFRPWYDLSVMVFQTPERLPHALVLLNAVTT